MSENMMKNVTPPEPKQPTRDEIIQQFLDNIQKELVLISQIEDLMDQMSIEQADLESWERRAAHDQDIFGRDDKKIKHRKTDIENFKKEIAVKEDQLHQLTPMFDQLIQACNTVLHSIENLATTDKLSSKDRMRAVKQMLESLHQLFEAGKKEADVIADQQIVDYLIQSGDFDSDVMKKMVNQLIDDSGRVASAFLSYFDMLDQDIQDLRDDKRNQMERDSDRSNSDWFFAGGFVGYDKYERREAYDDALMQAESDAMNSIAGMLGSPDAALMQMSLEMNNIEKKLIAILNSDISKEGKANQIKKLMALALGIAAVMIETVAKEKREAQQRMAKGSTRVMENCVEDTVVQQKAMAVAQERAQLMKTVEIAATIIIGVVLIVMAPELEAQIAIGAMTGLSASGVLDKLSEKIADVMHISKTWADLIVSAMCAIATAGTGAALDGAMGSITAKVADEGAILASKEMETILEDASALLKNNLETGLVKLSPEEMDLAQNQLRQEILGAAKEGMKKTAMQSTRKNIFALLTQFGKQQGREELAQQMEKAALIAAKDAAEQLVPKIGMASEEEIEAIRITAATKGAAEATHTSEMDIEKNTGKTAFERARSRAASGWEYGGLATNAMIDTFKKMGIVKDDHGVLMMLLQIYQALSLAKMQGKAMGVSMGSMMEGSLAQMIGVGMEATGIGLNAVGQYGTYQVLADQKKIVEPMAKNQARLGLATFLQDRIITEGKQEADRDAQEMQSMQRAAFDAAGHLYTDAVSNLLASQAV